MQTQGIKFAIFRLNTRYSLRERLIEEKYNTTFLFI